MAFTPPICWEKCQAASGVIHLAHTFFGDQDLNIVDFADRVNEKGGAVDFTYVAYTVRLEDYAKACRAQGGEIVSDVCSVANKEVAPQFGG